MAVDYKIISIGTLSHNRLWDENVSVRTAHATTTLISDGDRLILVDPSLPGKILAAMFNERTGKQLDAVTDVFCTTLRPVHRRGLDALPNARWWTSEMELTSYRDHLETIAGSSERLDSEDSQFIEADLKLLGRFSPAPEKFTEQVQLYPLFGASPGSAGLLLAPATSTIIIAGDAAITSEHIQAGQIWRNCNDTEAALESLTDLLELADVIIPGHDNVMFSVRRWL